MSATTAQRRALVVENDDSIRRLVAKVLSREGFEIDQASNPDDAIARLQSDAGYSLVILDLMLQPRGGADVVAFLKDHFPPTLRRLVIVTTAPQAVRHGLPDDVCSVVSKPFDLEALIEAIHECAE